MAKSAELTLSSWNKGFDESLDGTDSIEGEEDSIRELSFGQYLRRERVLRGISREEILRITKVSPEYYEALESNKFDRLPPRPFVMGFLRVLSSYAGLNGDEVVNRYLSELNSQESDDESFPFITRSRLRIPHGRKILMVLGIFVLFGLMFAPLLRR